MKVKAYESPSWEHPAVKAWASLGPTRLLPERVGTIQRTVFRLDGAGPGGGAVIAKQCRRKTAECERRIYQDFLMPSGISSVRYYGSVDDEDERFTWLFLEDAGDEEYSPSIPEHRRLGARWLGAMHVAAATIGARLSVPDRGPDIYLGHLREARAHISRNLSGRPLPRDHDAAVLDTVVSRCDFLEARWRHVESFCRRMPLTLVHGDFARQNVRVRRSPDGLVLLPFDWETAGWGVPAADLAGCATFAAQFPRLAHVLSGCADLGVYQSVIGNLWPELDIEDLQRLANLGSIFRVLASIQWDTWMLDRPAPNDFMGEFIDCIQMYVALLDAAIPAAELDRRAEH
ncbi:MAG: hypothetical protein DMF89_18390 [Acidobacteria bacterium]|nr:MAG: hypothetical protein DMF90_15885 [Acidobacteriota bacterium]PYR47715.1 MAG: hypothetical protein DMF89_18390 [Acidobacteriota bacterium]